MSHGDGILLARGRAELIDILKAVTMHLQTLADDCHTKFSNESQYLAQSIGHERTFGNLYADNLPILLRRVFLQESDKPDRRKRKPRLAVLSRQLHLPMDAVLDEIKEYIDHLI